MSRDGSNMSGAGLDTLVALYGEDFGYGDVLADPPPERAPIARETVSHVYGEIWNRPELSVRDRRLLTIGVVAALGRVDLAEKQFFGALLNEELTREQLGEVVLHLAYYAGWPNGQAMQSAARMAVERATSGSG